VHDGAALVRTVLLAILLASCAPRAVSVGPDHPANPDAEAGRLAGPPAALRADLQTPVPAEAAPAQSHEGHTMPAGSEPIKESDKTPPASDAKPAEEPVAPTKPKTTKPKSPTKPKTTTKPKTPAPTGHEGHNMDEMKPKSPAPTGHEGHNMDDMKPKRPPAPSGHEGHH
jgi:hypothetical protein